MRARLALMHCGAQCILREVALKAKPSEMLSVSSKGTVPVLLVPSEKNNSTQSVNTTNGSLTNYKVIDESIDIMHWAMKENATRHLDNAEAWLATENLNSDEIDALISRNDDEFKSQLDKYKYSDRHPEHPQSYYLEQAMPYLNALETVLRNSQYLGGSQFRFIDAAILPFIRQFSMVDTKQFEALELPRLQQWLAHGLQSELFASIMHKISPWDPDTSEAPIVFGK